jgi:hypothetical protein
LLRNPKTCDRQEGENGQQNGKKRHGGGTFRR